MVLHFGHDSFRVRAPMSLRHGVPNNLPLAVYPEPRRVRLLLLRWCPASVPRVLRHACGNSRGLANCRVWTRRSSLLVCAFARRRREESTLPPLLPQVLILNGLRASLSRLESAFTEKAHRKSFRMCIYKKQAGGAEPLQLKT